MDNFSKFFSLIYQIYSQHFLHNQIIILLKLNLHNKTTELKSKLIITKNSWKSVSQNFQKNGTVFVGFYCLNIPTRSDRICLTLTNNKTVIWKCNIIQSLWVKNIDCENLAMYNVHSVQYKIELIFESEYI